MKREITITLQYDMAIGKVNLNEIVYRFKEVRDPLMLPMRKKYYFFSADPRGIGSAFHGAGRAEKK